MADMDGTLLNDQKELPKDFKKLVIQLSKMNIKMGIASGRQYATLRSFFDDLIDEMVFVSDNGSFVYAQDELLFSASMSEATYQEVIRRIKPYQVPFIVSGSQGAHVLQSDDATTINEINHYYHDQVVHSTYDDIHDEAGKIAILDFSKNLPIANLLDDLEDVVIVRSGDIWWDIMPKTTHKGNAIKALQEVYDISIDETVVFGDYMNDYEMLQSATYSFAMDNAIDEIKTIANFIAPSNNDEGVAQVIKQILAGSFETLWIK